MLVGPPADAAHGLNHAATEETDDIDQMRALAVDDAAAFGGIQFRCKTRALQPIVVVHGADLHDAAQPAAANHIPHGADRCTVNLRVALEIFDAVGLAGPQHAVAFGQRHRHRLFTNDVLAVTRRGDDMLGMKCVGRRDPDCVDPIGAAHLLDAGEGRATVLGGKALTHVRADVGATGQNVR